MIMTAMNPGLMKLKIYIKEIYGFKSTQAPISLSHGGLVAVSIS